ncbi:GreA/GreB family elongation factor [Fictibacillus phosphorivorans]|uniref:GreA/GreB family elongation factor n=1 Tax=Fictibacillus phosphorivorans TaxID=1221500 RepID=UPI00203D8342|nr:GreA/GreB family elongation factor [Fictibacillus phosphorivorans]MCM3719848.1 GreA/GreB family elongation factor [Fictibacillus phosphorivorans]MCM3777538.1 GreA/GreB family elongation factor [Fictibacillus phosphorivorans]
MGMLKLTQEGTRKLEKELQYLKKRKKEFRNSPEKGFIMSRIEEIENILSSSVTWPAVREAGDFVEVGSTITIEETVYKERYTYTIVHPYEADPRDNMISLHSPIATAAIGKTVNAFICIQVPAGENLTYNIIDIQNC